MQGQPAGQGLLPPIGSPRAASPQLKWGQQRKGLQLESHTGWAATLGTQPHPLGLWSWQMGVKGSRLQAREGPLAADAGGLACKALRLPEAAGPASCAAGLPWTLSPPSARPATAGRIFPGPVTWCGSVLLWGRAGYQEEPGGRGPGNRGNLTEANHPLCTGASTHGHWLNAAQALLLPHSPSGKLSQRGGGA